MHKFIPSIMRFPVFLKSAFLLSCLFVFFNESKAQTTLAAGDVAVLGINATNPDLFSFVILKPIATGTVINFTDNGFTTNNTTGRTGEGYLTFTAASAYSAGTTFSWQNAATNSTEFSSNAPTNFSFNASGDQLFIFQGNGTGGTTINTNFGTQSATTSNTQWTAQNLTLLYGINYGAALLTSGTTAAGTTIQPSTTLLPATSFLNLPAATQNNGYFSNTGSAATNVSLSNTASALMALFVDPSKWFTQSNATGATTFPTFNIGVCSSIVTPTVGIAALPSGSICAGTSVTFTATAANTGGGTVNYDFKVNGSSVQSGASNTYTTTTLSNNNTVTCSITITGGTCISTTTTASNTITASVNANLTPTVGIAALPSGSICAGTSVTFTATAANTGGGTVNYDFEVNGSSVQSGASNTYTTTTLSNNNTVACSITITGGTCISTTTSSSNTITASVNANLTPTVGIAALPSGSICAGTSVTFTAIAANTGGGTVNYDFKVNGSSVQSSSSNTYGSTTLNNNDVVTCDITITGSNCLLSNNASSNSISMTVNSNLTPSVSIAALPVGAICAGTSVSFTATSANIGGGSVNYTFKVNGNSVQNSGSNTYTTTALVNNDAVTCDISVSSGICLTTTSSSSNSITIPVNANLAPSVSIAALPAGAICTGASVTFTATAGSVGVGSVNYDFKVNGNSVQSSASSTYTTTALLNNDAVTCDISVTGGTCLTTTTASSNTISITVGSNITPTISGALSFCSGGSTILDAGAGYVSYFWSSGETSQTITVTTGGNYFVTVSNGVCSGTSAPVTVAVITTPNQPSNFTTSAAFVNPGQTGVIYTIPNDVTASSYNWSYSGTGATINGSGNSVTVDFSLSATAGTLSVTATNSCGTSTARTINIGINPPAFTAGRLVVLQTSNTASKASSPVTLKEITTTGAAGVTIPIPATGNYPFQTSGVYGGSEGFLSTSADGKLILLGGYGTSSTVADITASPSASIPRVVGTVTQSGFYSQVASSNTFFNANDIRGAVSDGTNYWASGASTANVDGINYYGPGAQAGLATGATPPKAYGLRIFNGNIYYSTQKAGPTNSATQLGIFQLGSGLPTSNPVTAGQVINTGATAIPEDFSFNPAMNVCYIAINLNTAVGGIQKWTKSGSVWSLAYTLGTGLTNIGAYGLVVDYSGANPILYATTFETAGNRVVKITDNGSAASSPATTLVTAASGVFYKGITFAPVDAGTATVNLTISTNTASEAGATVVTVTAISSSPVSTNQTVSLNVSGTGITSGDYDLSNTTITIPAGATTGSVSFTVVDDVVFEPTETAVLTISNPSSGILLGTTISQNVIIADNDNTAPTIAINVNTTSDYIDGASVVSPASPYSLSGVIADVTDPASNLGIDFIVDDNETAAAGLTVTATSSNTAVVPNANVTITGTGSVRNVKITPSSVGYTNISVVVNDGINSTSYVIAYAASVRTPDIAPANTFWHTGMSDASDGIALDNNYYISGDDEYDVLNVYSRNASGLPVVSYNYASNLNLPDPGHPEVDVEAATSSAAVSNKLYWTGSMSNGSSPFNNKPNRDRLFATTVTGTGAATAFSFSGYVNIRTALLAWGDANGYNFTASAANGVDSKAPNGFAIEGMVFGPDNTTLYLGLRAPLVPTSTRTNAVIAPILNFETWFNNGSPSGDPTFGSPIELNLNNRGIRDITRLSNGTYVLIAGSPGDGGVSDLYKWSGNPTDAPVLVTSAASGVLNMEGILQVNDNNSQLSSTQLQVITDGGSSLLYNDGFEAKDLAANYRKFRSDVLTGLDLNLCSGFAAGITNNTGTTVLSCSAPAISLTATGGLSYSWSNGTTVVGTSANLFITNPATYTVTVTGNNGCTGTANITITQVLDNINPTITAPAPVSACTNSGCTATGVNLGTPVTADNCSVASVTNNEPASFPLGTTTVTWTVTDASGNTATATQTVTVTDGTAPSIYITQSGLTPGVTGPSSSATPYILPVSNGVKFTSILTTPDVVGGYTMCGIPDGLGAFDNCNGTFTLLMNHEILNNLGAVRAHGSIGSFVSKWIINKNNLSVVSGSDLMQNVNLWNTGTSTYTTYNSANPSTLARFGRFCSADLPAPSAFYNPATGLGTKERIFMNGEETNDESRGFAHIVTGPNGGTSWELPALGKAAWENAVANPASGNKTVVGEMNDGTDGQVYFYIGTKTNTGTEIEKAGLTNGHPFGVKVTGFPVERVNSTTINTPPAAGTHFDLVDIGDVRNITGAVFNTNSNTAGVTKFSRPEDGAWDPSNPSDFYFNTTDQLDQVADGVGTQVGRSRVWKLHFTNINSPELGGTIEAVLDGTEGINMLDNMTIDKSGHIILLEDVGNAAHNGKVWQYTIATDQLLQIGKHDPARFGNIGVSATAPFNQDEETSGVIDVSDILGAGMHLLVDQAHYAISGQAVEGGQLLAMFVPASVGTVSTAIDTIRTNTNSGCTATGVALGTPATADNCSVASVTNNAPSSFPVGTTNVIWTVTDGSGNTASATQVVIVTASQYSLTATSGIGGSITPVGTTTVNCGDNVTYTITPNACYSISDVVVDGVSQGAVGTYTFTNVTANHTISATFSLNTYTITVSASATGSITPATGSANCGDNATYTITPNACYSIADVVVDGVSQGAVGTYTFTNVTANHTISATFSLNTYTITVTAGANGSITPATGSVNCGDNATYTITADACYSIADVVVDGISIGAVGTYTFTNVTAAHTISASFSLNTYTITVSAGANGSITPSTGSVNCGSNATYTITPAACYHVQDVLVDAVSVGAVTSYSFTNVTANHTISVSFALNASLAVSISGPVNVCPFVGTGDPVTYTFTAAGATGYSYILPPNVALQSSTANSITVTFLNGFTAQANKQIKVTALSPCGNSPQLIYYLAAQAPGTPQPIAGTTSVCTVIGTAGTITYTIPSVPGAATYNWSAQSGTTTITHPNGPGVNDTTVNVSFSNSFTGSNITVFASSPCGNSSTRSLALTKVNPSTPGLISGPTNACPYMAPGGTPATYTVALVTGATSYTWSVPPGFITLVGQGTNTISFTYPNTFVSGSITVTASNGCGTSAARSLSISKLAPATPSVIDVIQTQPCPNRVYTYTLSAMPANATSVQWTVPVGATLVSGQGSISITVSYPGTAITGNVTAQAFNNCGSSTIRITAVKLPACELVRPMAKGGTVTTEPSETMQVNVFPNPTVSDFKMQVITAGKQTINVRIMDAQGRSFRSFVVMPYQTINVGSDLTAGTYMLEVRQGNVVKVTKLLKF